jgi:SOS-response transcriptional repressor LexA
MSEPRPAPRRTIPIAPAPAGELGACSGAEPFALMVLGDSMAPEFVEGDVIVIEPEGLATDGAFVLAFARDEWIFRQLAARDGGWTLRALDPRCPAIGIPDLSAVRGVVIQKSRPGQRRALKRYGPP